LQPDILEQHSGAFVTVTTFGLAISGQRKVTRQTINKAVTPALRMTFQLNSGLIQIKESLSTSKCVIAGRKWKNHQRIRFPMFTTSRSAIVLLLFGAAVLLAGGPPPALKDPFVDNFIGDLSVAREMANGRTIECTVRGEWVLKHQFVQLHYGAGEKEPQYEALVFIGFDEAAKKHVCHWVDVFGGRYSGLGRGKLDPNLLGIEFRFDSKEDSLTNRFRFDSERKSWTLLIRQEDNGQWKTFAEGKWTRK